MLPQGSSVHCCGTPPRLGVVLEVLHEILQRAVLPCDASRPEDMGMRFSSQPARSGRPPGSPGGRQPVKPGGPRARAALAHRAPWGSPRPRTPPLTRATCAPHPWPAVRGGRGGGERDSQGPCIENPPGLPTQSVLSSPPWQLACRYRSGASSPSGCASPAAASGASCCAARLAPTPGPSTASCGPGASWMWQFCKQGAASAAPLASNASAPRPAPLCAALTTSPAPTHPSTAP